MIFNINSAMKHSYSNDDTCFSIDVIDEILKEYFNTLLDEYSKILHSFEGTFLEEEIFAVFDEFMAMTADKNSNSESNTKEPLFEKITINTEYKIKASLEEPPTNLKLKPLPDNMEYVFLEEPSFFLYFQIPIDLIDQEKTTFTCPFGTYTYRRMPSGLCNAPTTFQRCMLAIFHDMIEELDEVFMDDFFVFGNSFETCLNNLDKMLQHCKDVHVVLNWEKRDFMVKEGIVLGHKGHWKRNYHVYLAELLKKKKQVDTASSLGKMTTKSFPHRPERVTDLLEIIHTDDYALESATRILNMVPTKKVDKTPYELWYRKVPNVPDLKGAIDIKEIQDDDTSLFENTSKIPMEVEGFEPPREEVILVCRSERTHQAPICLCLNVEMEEHSLGDLNEPSSYKAAMLDLESNKWLDAMNVEMKSMIDNMVWILVDLPHNCKTVGRLITEFYDYEIWKMDVKTTFLNGYLDEDIYMVQPKNFVDPKHPRKVCKLQRSIYGLKQASKSWNKRFDEEIKRHILMHERLDLNNTQGDSTPKEVKRRQNVPYALAVGSIMYAMRCTRPDVAFAQNITSWFQQNLGETH
nr:reverse transcriptase domain-containing protein [Tanacetum cinerariifolium]